MDDGPEDKLSLRDIAALFTAALISHGANVSNGESVEKTIEQAYELAAIFDDTEYELEDDDGEEEPQPS
jgi:hypothetical protein